MASRIVARLLIRFLVPAGSKPRWHHVLAIVGVSILLFAGGLGAAFDLATGDYLPAAAALGAFGLGVIGVLLLRRSLARTIPGKAQAVQFIRLAPSPSRTDQTAKLAGPSPPRPAVRSQPQAPPLRAVAPAAKPAQVIFQKVGAPQSTRPTARPATAALK